MRNECMHVQCSLCIHNYTIGPEGSVNNHAA